MKKEQYFKKAVQVRVTEDTRDKIFMIAHYDDVNSKDVIGPLIDRKINSLKRKGVKFE